MRDRGSGRGPVFVVDDDLEFARSIDRLLATAGRDCATYGSAELFLDAHRGNPDGVIVLDVRLPGMSGTDLHDRLIARGSPARVIFVTASDDRRSRERALGRGARAWFEKPVDADQLLLAIESAC